MGKKKKSKASKLLRMSDEEKARYLQHKVEQEQEAKRRREQLIKAWMMKKIKKEQAFARLNLAKINMSWHQLLRKRKIEAMKKDIGYMQEWLDFILTLKNRIINNLMEEIEESEAQYSYNFKAHCLHIDNYIDFHNTWVSELEKVFEKDRDDLIDVYRGTMEKYDTEFKDNLDHLKTIIFAQNQNAHAEIKDDYEYYMKKNYEVMKNSEETLAALVASRESKSASLWRRIACSVRLYVRRTDTRRHHMAELRRLDAESAIEIADNEERIRRLEHSIAKLRQQYSILVEDNDVYLNQLKADEKQKSKEIIRDRKNLMRFKDIDKRKITVLTTSFNDCLRHLNENLKIVEYCEFLFFSCQKYESICEKLNKWLSKNYGLKYPYVGLPPPVETTDNLVVKKDDLAYDDFVLEGQPLFSDVKTDNLLFKGHQLVVDTKKIITKIFTTKKQTSKRSSAPPKLQLHSGKVRPETGVSRKSKPSTGRDVPSASTTDKPGVSTLSKVVIQAKPQPSTYSSGSSLTSNRIIEEVDTEKSETVCRLDVEYGHLWKLENFWNFHSKVVVDMIDLKEEKKSLLYNNERMKVLLRLLLEAAALRGGEVELETASTVTSMRSAISATIRSMCN